jgi:Helix-turn-helix domain
MQGKIMSNTKSKSNAKPELVAGEFVRRDTFVVYGWRMKVMRGITPTERALLSILRDYCGDHDGDFYCYPGIGELAQALGRSDRTVQRTIRSLEAKRLVQTGVKPGRRGKDAPPGNIIRLLVPHTETSPRPSGRGNVIRLVVSNDVVEQGPEDVAYIEERGEAVDEVTCEEYESARILPLPMREARLNAASKVTSLSAKGDISVVEKVTPVSPEVKFLSFEDRPYEVSENATSLSKKKETQVEQEAKLSDTTQSSLPGDSENPNPPTPLSLSVDFSKTELPAPKPGEKVHYNGLTISQMKEMERREDEKYGDGFPSLADDDLESAPAQAAITYKGVILTAPMIKYAEELGLGQIIEQKFEEWVDRTELQRSQWCNKKFREMWEGWCRNALKFAKNRAREEMGRNLRRG